MADDEELTDLQSAVEDPSVLAAVEALTSKIQAPALPDPLDGPVTLPGGFVRVKVDSGTQFEVVTKAWVRELNGEHEERIARAKLRDDVHAFTQAVLEAGVERLGDATPTRTDFDSLVMGDRDFLLMEIARVTYGDEIEYQDFPCPFCNKEFTFSLSLSEDIPVKRLDKVEDSTFEVRIKNDRIAVVHLPTGEITDAVAKAETPAEANTILIANCVEEIRSPKGVTRLDGDANAARKLSIPDRRTLVTAMGEHMPGPQYNGVKFAHEPGCGEEIRLTVTLADLFRGL